MRRSQISTFVIAGIVIIILVGAAYIYVSKPDLAEERKPVEFTPELLTLHMDSCIRELTIRSMTDFGVCDKISEFDYTITKNLSHCLNLEQYEPYYDITARDEPDLLEVDMNEDRIKVSLDYPITLTDYQKVIEFESRELTIPMHKSILIELEGGRTRKDYVLVSYDERLELNIPKGTKVTSDGNEVDEVGVKINELCPLNPGLLGEVKYSFSPEPIEFEPYAFLTIRYEDEDVSQHAGEEKFKVAYLEDVEWKYLKSSSNPEENKAIAKVGHLSDWAASCYGSHKTGMQAFMQNALGYPDEVKRWEIIDKDLRCVSEFAGPCGFVKFITFTKGEGLEFFYYRVLNDTYEYELFPMTTLKELGPPEGYWFHSGFCKGASDGTSYKHSSCKIPGSDPEEACDSYSYDCWYGENEDGSSKPDYDYTDVIEEAIELIDFIHEDKPEYPLFIEIWNEPNLNLEWHDISLTDYEISEFTRYFVEMATAIKELPHSDSIRIITPGLAPTEGAKFCELKPSKAKSVAGHTPPLEDHWFTGFFNSDFCAKLENDYMAGSVNLCTAEGLPEFTDPECLNVGECKVDVDTGDDCPSGEIYTEQEKYDCECVPRNDYIDQMNSLRETYLGKGALIFDDINAAEKTCSMTSPEDDTGVNQADEIRQRILDSFEEHCFEKITAVATETYIRKMVESEYGDQMCEVMDMYGDHPAPLWGQHEAYDGGDYPYGMEAYKQRFSILSSLCGFDEDECTEADMEDTDGDGLLDLDDNCPEQDNPGQEDWNDNGIGDLCEDWDDDGTNDGEDMCPEDSAAQSGPDSDGDGIADSCDNCPDIVNRKQVDLDLDGIGDACDPQTDSDSVDNPEDNCPYEDNDDQDDSDGDGVGDACDNCPEKANPDQMDWNDNNAGDMCEDYDEDGFIDEEDLCPDFKSSENLAEFCEPTALCPGKVFITEVAYAPSPGTSFNVDDWTGHMECAFEAWYEDDNVFGVTPFHLGDEDVNTDEFRDYAWTTSVREDGCTGKDIFDEIADGEYACDAEPEPEECLEGDAVIFGDSITFGFNNYDCDGQDIIGEALSAAGFDVAVDYSGNPSEVAAMTPPPEGNPIAVDRIDDIRGYDIVMLFHGVNQDAGGAATYEDAYRHIIDELGDDVTFLILTPIAHCANDNINTFTDVADAAHRIRDDYDNVYVVEINEDMATELASIGCEAWFDMDDPRPHNPATDPDPPYDWVHPYCRDDDAYHLIADRIVEKFQEIC